MIEHIQESLPSLPHALSVILINLYDRRGMSRGKYFKNI